MDKNSSTGAWPRYGVVIVPFLGIIVISAGGAVLVGWLCDIPVLTNMLPGFVAMKANIAVGFILAGLSLALLGLASRFASVRWLAQACAATAALLGLLTLCRYLFGLNFSIDQLLFRELTGTISTLSLDRTAPATALNFLVFGCALLLLGYRRGIATAQRLVLFTGLLGLLTLLRCLYGATALLGIGRYIQMAVYTAVLCILLSLGVLLRYPADGPMRMVTSDSRGGWLLRRLAPFIVMIPIILGYLWVQGERSSYFEGELGTALMMIAVMLLLLGSVWWIARTLNQYDIARKREEENLRRFATVVLDSNDAITIQDFDGRITAWNRGAELMYGYSETEALLANIEFLTAPGKVAEQQEFIRRLIAGEAVTSFETQRVTKDGRVLDVWMTVTKLTDETGNPMGLASTERDITARKREEENLFNANIEIKAANHKLLAALTQAGILTNEAKKAREQVEEKSIELGHQLVHDNLTGLPNRYYLEQYLCDLLTASAGNKSSNMVVLFLDLDKFKQINDTLGHAIGDLLLIETGKRLQSCLRSEDVLARMGGDEFSVILPRCNRRSIAQSVASRMIDSISRPFEIAGHRFVIGVSIGLASYPSGGTDTVTLLKHADAAMYQAKQSGRGIFCWFTGDVDVNSRPRIDLEMDIRAALEKGQFHVYYQPIVSLEHGNILAAEALLRWEHPEKGMISPSLIIPIAEEIGMMIQIGDYVLRTACAQTMAWRDQGIHLSHLAVNVSTKQVRDTGWLDSVSAALSDTGLDARCLHLEVTETDFAADCELAREILQEVERLGIGVTIDDFGVGRSSLSRLKDFPVIHLKIDGSFIRDIEHSENTRSLVRSIVEMAHGQRLKVTAEWVETELQMEILRSIGCDFAQGYFISPALPAKAFRDLIREWNPTTRCARVRNWPDQVYPRQGGQHSGVAAVPAGQGQFREEPGQAQVAHGS